MKKIAVNKTELNAKLAEISRAMGRAGWFYNVSTKPHKDENKIWIVIG